LTAIPLGYPRAYQAAPHRQASRITHAPIATIIPVASAIGMNWSGATMPLLG